jgi:hypothetical protein
MEPHVGQLFELRVVEAMTGIEQARLSLPSIAMTSFDLEVGGLEVGASYRIDFYADMNGNGAYDAPPTDHAWRLEVADLAERETIAFMHNTNFDDIAWPPHMDGTIADGEYRHTLLDPQTGIEVHWQNDGSTLYVGLIGPGTGWVAIGFDPVRRMQGANIIIAAVVNETLQIQDHFGTAQTAHREDVVSQIIEAAGREIEGRTFVEFSYPLDTGEEDDKPLVPGSELSIILAYHRTSDRLSARHSERSTNTITLDD